MAFLEIHGFKKSFGTNRVLKDIDLELEKGQVMAIIGSSGSGKSTLLRCMNFLETPDEGRMIVGNETVLDIKMTDYDLAHFLKLRKKQLKRDIIDIKGKNKTNKIKKELAEYKNELISLGVQKKVEKKKRENEEDRRKKRLHFGLVFQNFNLFPHKNVLDNLMLARLLNDPIASRADGKGRIKEDCLALLKRVGLSSKVRAYPCELSGGQQQRVAIARALALNPDILCFDEPTSALDPELTGEVLKVIRSLKDTGATMIVVTHEMNFAKEVADIVVVMADGIIEEQGPPKEVFENPKSEKTKRFLLISENAIEVSLADEE